MQDNATAHTNKQFLLPLRDAFGEPVIRKRPPYYPHLKLHDFYLCSLLRDKIFVNYPCMWRKLKKKLFQSLWMSPKKWGVHYYKMCWKTMSLHAGEGHSQNLFFFFFFLLCCKVTMINVISSNDKKDCGHCC
jgi:hypothetical protein